MCAFDNRFVVSVLAVVHRTANVYFWGVVEVGAGSKIIAALSTGRNTISKAMLRLMAPSGVQFYTDKPSLEGDGAYVQLFSSV